MHKLSQFEMSCVRWTAIHFRHSWSHRIRYLVLWWRGMPHAPPPPSQPKNIISVGGGAFSSLRGLWGKIGQCIPRLRFFFFFLSGDQLARTNCTLYVRISPQWLSELRWLWPSSLTSCIWVHFPGRFPHHAWTAWSAHSNFVGSRMYTCLGVTCLCTFCRMTGVS